MMKRLLIPLALYCLTMPAISASESAGLMVDDEELSGTQAKRKESSLPAPANAEESLFPRSSLSLALSHFTWGVEIGTSVDLTGNDMSTLNGDVIIGYKNDFIRTVGVGAGIHRAFGTGDNFIPVYLVFRSSFRKRPSLFFLNFKAGYSFNTISDSPAFGDVWGTLGVGINLAMSKRFMSHIILGYEFRHFTKNHQSLIHLNESNVSLAKVSFGVNF